MTRPSLVRTSSRTQIALCAALVTCALLATTLASDARKEDKKEDKREDKKNDKKQDKQEDTLLIWSGDESRTAADFIAVVDFDPGSRTYGKVVRTVPLTGASAIGNEPHHVGLSRDGRTLALGGLLSILKQQDEVFFYDVSNPRTPTFIASDDPPDASITDDFAALDDGGFLATFMGGADGAQPGRVIEYDARLNRTGSWPSNPPADGFNPHGISIDEKKNLMVTSDFVCPLMTLHVHGTGTGSLHLRGTVRVWDLANRTILRTVDVNPGQPSGTMDVALIPHDSRQRAFTAGMIDNRLYLIDTQEGTSTVAYDFDTPLFKVDGVGVIMPQLMRVNKNGTRLFVTVNYGGAAGKVAMFDIARPDRPRLMDVVDLGPGSGPHSVRLTRDEDRLVVTDYFLVEDLGPGGVVKVEGDHKVHVINVHGNRLELDRSFDLDMNRDISTGRARPHGVIMLPSGE